jgi:hypothetical protein
MKTQHGRYLRWLTDAGKGIFLEMSTEGLGETNGGGRLALT